MHIVLHLLYFVILAFHTVPEHGKNLVLFPEHDVFLSVSGQLTRNKNASNSFLVGL